jgi:Zn-dependent oligopeptidase
MSGDAFAAFEEAGLDNVEAIANTGKRFRDTVLALGCSKHPMEVFNPKISHIQMLPPTRTKPGFLVFYLKS